MTKEEYFEQAVNAFGDEKLDEAIEAYKKALEMDPNYQDALHGLGMALFNRGRVDEAIAAARKLIEIDQDDILAHTSLSMFYQSQGRMVSHQVAAALLAVLPLANLCLLEHSDIVSP